MKPNRDSPPDVVPDLPGPVDPDEPDLPVDLPGDDPDEPPMPDRPDEPPPPMKVELSHEGDARKNPEKLEENRQKLRVDDEHRTPEMQRGHRGTFP